MQSLVLPILLTLVFAPLCHTSSGLTCDSLPVLVQVYLRNHLNQSPLEPGMRERTGEQFVKSLDPSRVTLLQSEVEHLGQSVQGVFDSAMIGDCSVLENVREMMIERASEALAVATSILTDAYVLDESVELEIDPEARGFPGSVEERQALQLKLIHFQIASYLLGGLEMKEAKTQLIHRYEIGLKRARDRKPWQMLDLFISSFAQSLDPHTSFLAPSRLQDFQISMHLSLEGIGAQLTWKDGYTIVDEVIVGGAADRQGKLRPKDKILAVAQDTEPFVDVIDMDLPDVVQLIRGKKGTSVRLSILRQGVDTERFEITIVRDKVDIKDSAAKMEVTTFSHGGKDYRFAVLELPSFYGDPTGRRSSYRDVKELVQQAVRQKVDGMILNLSRNGGGLLEDAVRISGLFLHRGAVVATRSSDGRRNVLEDQDPGIQYPGPLVVLTTRRSASASEILAGAIKDYRRGIVVGDAHTFGKGTVQMFTPLSEELGGVTITTGMFFRPSGKSTQKDGVDADIQLPSIWDRDDFGEKSLDYVLPSTTIAQFRSHQANMPDIHAGYTPVTHQQIARLKTQSEARVKESTDFAKIGEEVAQVNRNRKVIRISEMMEESKKASEKEKADEGKTRAEVIAEYERPYLDEARTILAELVQLQE